MLLDLHQQARPNPGRLPAISDLVVVVVCVCVCVCVCVLVLLMFCFCDSRSQDWTITQNHEWNYRCFGCRDGHAHDQGFGYSVCRIHNYKDLAFKVSGMGGF